MNSIVESISGYAYYVCNEEKNKKREIQCKKIDGIEGFDHLCKKNFNSKLSLITIPHVYPQFTHPYFLKKALVKNVTANVFYHCKE